MNQNPKPKIEIQREEIPPVLEKSQDVLDTQAIQKILKLVEKLLQQKSEKPQSNPDAKQEIILLIQQFQKPQQRESFAKLPEAQQQEYLDNLVILARNYPSEKKQVLESTDSQLFALQQDTAKVVGGITIPNYLG